MYAVSNNRQNSLNVKRTSPSFAADLIIGEKAFQFIEADLLKRYRTYDPVLVKNHFDEEPFNATKIIDSLKTVFKRMTEQEGYYKLDGTVEIIKDKKEFFNDDVLSLVYKDAEGNVFKSQGKTGDYYNTQLLNEGIFSPSDLLQNKDFEKYKQEGPYSTVVGYLLDYVNRATARGKIQ